MHITLTELDAGDRDALTEFLVHKGPWPFHARPRPTVEQIHQAWDAGAYTSESDRTFWLEYAGRRIGLCGFADLTDDTPILDLRLANDERGHGLGTGALRAATAWVFNEIATARRFEGTARVDNLAMRRTFERCGFVREAYYREGWPSADATYDAVGYAILRTDWESGTTTPVP
ncbi:GNAT family N-acetyltransferase [Solicola gregarius]|uniref:GNAT family N-acetyltransferase n=1 Tax=Solicola gregarius TaxID=2908642 RepID=A0AA46TEH8_9ACTN|nr:GNAT family protein [Solicola gregarius]UYM03879.1 GNAT family N-acetyltransferase [Solicola gregarius]